MTSRTGTIAVILVWAVASLGGCQKKETIAGRATTPVPVPTTKRPTPLVTQVQGALAEAAEKNRNAYANMSFEEFKKSKAVFKEPFEGGKYIVNGDTPIVTEKQLRDFYEMKVRVSPTPTPKSTTGTAELIVYRINGLDQVWDQQQKRKLTYCVSKPGFGNKYEVVVADVESATGAWKQVADVDFQHDATQDNQCTASNGSVVFDVRPVDVGGQYLARAFFPNESRATRNVLIDKTALDLTPDEKPQLDGILRHELGHTLGFRHEHTRPESGRCFEDSNWGVLGDYDPYSVMHYPQCNGKGDWSLTLTDKDKSGAACLYGPAAGFTIDPSLISPGVSCAPTPAAGTGHPKTTSIALKSVKKGKENHDGSFAVVPGSVFKVVMGGAGSSGDPDLYVRFGTGQGWPAVDKYDCRPYLEGPDETCSINVPNDKQTAFVMVRGYDDGTYGLQISYVSPTN